MTTTYRHYNKRRFKTEYKSIDTSTLKGLKQAERLHNAGWVTERAIGLFIIRFSRTVKLKSKECI